MLASERLCDICGRPATGPQARRVEVWPAAHAGAPEIVWYCSEACWDGDDGDWRPELCPACGRWIRLHADALDLRDPRSPQFAIRDDGDWVCRRCAGIPADAPLALA